MTELRVWSWRRCVQKSAISSKCKFVLLNLAVHMNDAGESCFPSIDEQIEDTGLSKSSIHRALKEAVAFGLLYVGKEKRFVKQASKRGNKVAIPHDCNDYIACYPKSFELQRKSTKLQRESADSVTQTPSILEDDEPKIDSVTEIPTTSIDSVTQTKSIVSQRHPNSTYNNSTYNTPLTPLRGEPPIDFFEFLKIWNAETGQNAQELTPQRKKRLQAVVGKLVKHYEIPPPGAWRRYCEVIQASDFLAGRQKDWAATLDWVITPGNVTKILEGHYVNRARKDHKPTVAGTGYLARQRAIAAGLAQPPQDQLGRPSMDAGQSPKCRTDGEPPRIGVVTKRMGGTADAPHHA